jgi:hypothetical protein
VIDDDDDDDGILSTYLGRLSTQNIILSQLALEKVVLADS